MPQLIISTYLSQAFWLLLCFCLLWFMLAVFIMPKMADIIEQRKRKIADYVQKAENYSRQAKLSLENYNSALAKAKSEAQSKQEENKKVLQARLQQKEDKITRQLNEKIAAKELSLAKEKQETLQQIDAIAQNLALDLVQKLGFSNITREQIALVAKENGKNE